MIQHQIDNKESNHTENPTAILQEIQRTLNTYEADFNGETDLFDLLREREERVESVIDMLTSKANEGNTDAETIQAIKLLKKSWEQLATCLYAIEDENETLKDVVFNSKLPPEELRN